MRHTDDYRPPSWYAIAEAIEAAKARARLTGCGCCVAGNKLRVYCDTHAPQLAAEDLPSLNFRASAQPAAPARTEADDE
jgi:hypothetical protein